MLGTFLCPPSWSALSPPPGPCSPLAQQLHLQVPEPGLSCRQASASAAPSARNTSSRLPSLGLEEQTPWLCSLCRQRSLSKETEALLCTGCWEGAR